MSLGKPSFSLTALAVMRLASIVSVEICCRGPQEERGARDIDPAALGESTVRAGHDGAIPGDDAVAQREVALRA